MKKIPVSYWLYAIWLAGFASGAIMKDNHNYYFSAILGLSTGLILTRAGNKLEVK